MWKTILESSNKTYFLSFKSTRPWECSSCWMRVALLQTLKTSWRNLTRLPTSAPGERCTKSSSELRLKGSIETSEGTSWTASTSKSSKVRIRFRWGYPNVECAQILEACILWRYYLTAKEFTSMHVRDMARVTCRLWILAAFRLFTTSLTNICAVGKLLLSCGGPPLTVFQVG